MKLFDDAPSLAVLAQFTADIKQIGIEIDERNTKLKVPLNYLHPSKVLCRVGY